jgi:hypothetical protein
MAPGNPDHQALAAAVLAQPAGPAREELAQLLTTALQPLATRRAWASPDLRRLGDADDLIQEFLLTKVLPPSKLVVVLRGVATGDKDLLPRVKRGFINFLFSRLRKAAPPLSAIPLGSGAEAIDPQAPPDRWGLITERVAEQTATLRAARNDLNVEVPLHAILLLDERIRLARSIIVSFTPDDGRTVGNQTAYEMAESVTDWGADGATLLTPTGPPLDTAWKQLRAQTEDRPLAATAELIARVLGISRIAWSVWLTRGRMRLVLVRGEPAIRELFPNWPDGPFRQAAARREEAAHD